MALKFVTGMGKPRKGMEKQTHLSRAFKQVNRVHDPSGEHPSLTEDKRNYIALTETRTDEAKKIRSASMKKGKDWSPRRGKKLIPRKDGMSNTVTAGQSKESLLVSTPTNGTNTPRQSTGNTGENATQQTLLKSQQKTSQTTISSAEVFPANLLAWLEKEEDLTTPEALSFLTSLGFLRKKDPDIFYSKMLKVCLVMTKEKLSRLCLGFSPTLGMECNGRYLIVKTSEFPKTESGSSLSDILEDKVDQKYFLSSDKTKQLLKSLRQDKAKG